MVDSRGSPTRSHGVAKLIYSAIASLDRYVEDAQGDFDWAAPDEEVFAFVNDLERPIGTYLYGRRMYESMVYWETASTGSDQSAVSRDFAEIWRAAEKIVCSRTLQTASSTRTRVQEGMPGPAASPFRPGYGRSELGVGGGAVSTPERVPVAWARMIASSWAPNRNAVVEM